jgi:DNA repair ATPase RecN
MSKNFTNPEQPFEHLVRALQEGEARKISQCVEEIDHRLLDCHKSLEEYRRLHSSLRMINNQLSRLGAEPLTVVDELPTQDLSEIIESRIDHFKSTGKI